LGDPHLVGFKGSNGILQCRMLGAQTLGGYHDGVDNPGDVGATDGHFAAACRDTLDALTGSDVDCLVFHVSPAPESRAEGIERHG
jgi:hypothetical protein